MTDGLIGLVIIASTIVGAAVYWLIVQTTTRASRQCQQMLYRREMARVTAETQAAKQAAQQISHAAHRQMLNILAESLTRRERW